MADKRTLFMGDPGLTNRGIVAYTASATLDAEDANCIVTMTVAGANTLTLPPQADVEIPIGSHVDVVQLGAGATTVTAGSGVTLRNTGATAKPAAQYGKLRVTKIAINTWVLDGVVAAS